MKKYLPWQLLLDGWKTQREFQNSLSPEQKATSDAALSKLYWFAAEMIFIMLVIAIVTTII